MVIQKWVVRCLVIMLSVVLLGNGIIFLKYEINDKAM